MVLLFLLLGAVVSLIMHRNVALVFAMAWCIFLLYAEIKWLHHHIHTLNKGKTDE